MSIPLLILIASAVFVAVSLARSWRRGDLATRASHVWSDPAARLRALLLWGLAAVVFVVVAVLVGEWEAFLPVAVLAVVVAVYAIVGYRASHSPPSSS